MADTTQRLLTLLNLLQSRPVWTGPELSERLGVTDRSIRRDVGRLRDLGYPVNATQGVGGGYQLGRGKALPPLLLDDDEAIATAVALRLAALGTLAGASEAALRTLTKLDQVMPPRLRSEVAAIQETVDTLSTNQIEVDPDLLLGLARACRDRVRVEFDHLKGRAVPSVGGRPEQTEQPVPQRRRVEPYRLVAAGRRWYLMAFDLDRDDWRTFRLDRISELTPGTWRYTVRDHPDPVEFVSAALAARREITAKVIIHAPLPELTARIPTSVGTLRALSATSTELEAEVSSTYWLAFHLGALGYPFEVHSPPSLVAEVSQLAAQFGAAATQPAR